MFRKFRVLGGDIVVNKKDRILVFMICTFRWGEIVDKISKRMSLIMLDNSKWGKDKEIYILRDRFDYYVKIRL